MIISFWIETKFRNKQFGELMIDYLSFDLFCNKMTLLTRVLVYFADNPEFRGTGVIRDN